MPKVATTTAGKRKHGRVEKPEDILLH